MRAATRLCVLGLFLVSCGSDPPAGPPKQVTAAALFAAYSENSIAADADYKGRRLQIDGEIKDIGKDVLGRPYVTLEAGDAAWAVQAVFPNGKGSESVVAGFKKGQHISVLCTGEGKLLNVIAGDCR